MQYCAACALGPSGGQRQHCGAVAATDPDSEASVCNCTLRHLEVTFGKLHPRPHRYGAGVMMLMRTYLTFRFSWIPSPGQVLTSTLQLRNVQHKSLNAYEVLKTTTEFGAGPQQGCQTSLNRAQHESLAT